MSDDDGLEVTVSDMLKAFDLARDHYNAKSKICERMENRWQVALGIVDRAVMESDRGVEFMKLANKVDALEAELKALRGDGPITIGPIK